MIPGPVTYEHAADLLWSTAAHTVAGLIGTPDGDRGYLLVDALRILDRSDDPRCEIVHGIDVLSVDLPGYGRHSWFLCLEPSRNPWS